VDKIEHYDNIDGKKIGIILIFDTYGEKQYKKDFDRFVAYHKKLSLTGDKKEIYFKFYNQIKEFAFIPYNKFRECSMDFFSKIIFYLLKNNPCFIVSNGLNVQVKIVRSEDYFEYDDEVSDPENACFEMAGSLFLQLIVAPYFYFKHIDFSYLYRYFLHELTHFADDMKGYLLFNKKYEEKINKLARVKSAYNLNYLYLSMFNLREEGLPDFIARENSSIFDINPQGIRQYNNNLNKLIRLTRKRGAEPFYEREIGFDNLTPSGEYTNGRVMCLFIAMCIAKISKSPYNILVGSEKFFGYEHSNLNKLLSSNKVIHVSNLSREVITKAISLIKPVTHYYFIKLYEDYCKKLGISNNNMVMTRRRFYELKKKAITYAKDEKKKRLKNRGFVVVKPEYD